MRNIFHRPAPVRVVEASPAQVAATGAYGGTYDPVDNDRGYRRSGSTGRPVPEWTLEKSRAHSVAAYRLNPMAKAIIDTYTSFCVGDSGVHPQCSNADVAVVVQEFWDDPANDLGCRQELMLRDQMLVGETLLEMLVGAESGVVRFSPFDTTRIQDVVPYRGNPLWPDQVTFTPGVDEDAKPWPIVRVRDESGLRDGKAMFWAPWKTLVTDRRGMPFLSSVVDWLDNYDLILSNLIDRTTISRHIAYEVILKGETADVDGFVAQRGGTHIPASGTIEVHNEAVEWKPLEVSTGAAEDTQAAKSVLTLVAGGTGLSKTWLADPEDSNRATSLTMAEPVRRRVGGVQKVWLGYMTELCRFAVDRAVAAKRLPETVTATDPRTGVEYEVPAALCVTVTGPEVAAADAQIGAQVLLNLATGLEKLVAAQVLSPEAAKQAARKAWEDYVGVPYRAELDTPMAAPDDVATAVAEAKPLRLAR